MCSHGKWSDGIGGGAVDNSKSNACCSLSLGERVRVRAKAAHILKVVAHYAGLNRTRSNRFCRDWE